MTSLHPALPDDRPLAIAHRGGNSLAQAHEAIAVGADMLETDVWPFRGRLEIRHVKTMGPIPLLWDRWKLEPGWRKRLVLEEILEQTPIDTRIFLDLKGRQPWLGERIVERIEAFQPERQIILCGRTWKQLDALEDHPRVYRFYSVGDEKELAAVWPRLERMELRALSMHKHLATPELMAKLEEMDTTVICWTVNDPAEAARLYARGVDGFTSDNLELVRAIAEHRADAFTHLGVQP